MNDPTRPALDRIRASSQRLRRWMTVLLAVLWLLVVLENFGTVAMELRSGGLDGDWLRSAASRAVAACPEFFYLLALAGIRQALTAFADGAIFHRTVTRMLDRVGTMLAAGAFIGVFLVPLADRALGMSPGYWIAFDVAGVVLGALGLCLGVIARVLAHASSLQAELDEIF